MLDASSQHVRLEEASCPNCFSSGGAVEAEGPDYDCHCCGDQEFRLICCSSCGVYYLNPRPAADEVPRIYPAAEYYSYDFSRKINSVTRHARLARDLQKVREVTRLLSRAPETLRVLDIGAGDGTLLDAFAEVGFTADRLHGVEIDARAAGTLAGKGYRAFHVRVEEMPEPDEPFDAVTMIQLIEHVADPKELLRRIRTMLQPDGLLIIETPNMGSWDRRFFRRKTWGGYHFPRHWTLWDRSSIAATLRDCGFTPTKITTPPAAVLWAWSLNHIAQELRLGKRIERAFSMNNPLILGMLWGLELIPSGLSLSANMRIVARPS